MEIILVRNSETKKELYKHELAEGEKPADVLLLIERMSFDCPKKLIEIIMDPEREEREANAAKAKKDAEKK